MRLLTHLEFPTLNVLIDLRDGISMISTNLRFVSYWLTPTMFSQQFQWVWGSFS